MKVCLEEYRAIFESTLISKVYVGPWWLSHNWWDLMNSLKAMMIKKIVIIFLFCLGYSRDLDFMQWNSPGLYVIWGILLRLY